MNKKAIFIIFLIALGIRLINFIQIKDDFWFRTPLIDDCVYHAWAQTIVQGDWPSKTQGVFFMNPGYPYFLAIIYSIFKPNINAVALIQYIMGSVCCVLIYIIASKIFNTKVGVIAGLLSALYSVSVFYEGKLLSASSINFFNLLILLMLLFGALRSLTKYWFFAGIFLGFSTLFRPNILLFVPFVLFWTWTAVESKTKKEKVVFWAAFLSGLFLVIFPVMLRNYLLDKKMGLVLTTSSAGINFYIGNNSEARGTNVMPDFVTPCPGAMEKDFEREAERRLKKDLTFSEASNFWFKESMKWITHNPQKYLDLLWKKFILFWNYAEPPGNFRYETLKKFTKISNIPLLSFGVIAPLALVGIIISLAEKKKMVLLCLFYFYVVTYLMANLTFFVLSEYKFPVIPVLVLFAAYMAGWMITRIKQKRYLPASFSIIGVFMFGILINKNISHKFITIKDIADQHYSTGVIYANQGRQNEAIEEYKKAVYLYPHFVEARVNLGNLYVKKQMYSLAIDEYEKVLEINPTLLDVQKELKNLKEYQGKIYFNQALSFQKRGMIDQAIESYSQALLFGLENEREKIHYELGNCYVYKNMYDEALVNYKKAVKINPENYLAHQFLGNIYYLKSEKKKALEEWETSLKIFPNNPKLLENVKQLKIVITETSHNK